MSINVSNKEALSNLSKALAVAGSETYVVPKGMEMLSEVILGTHKTYRYIVITGILAKATNEDVNPITLQVGSKLEGAYDARSLCHDVFVDFERDFLDSALGGSNEPFVNNPARYTELSEENKVRRGNDRKLLENCIHVLSNLKTSAEAMHYLEAALYFVLQRETRSLISKLDSSGIDNQPNFLNFIKILLSQSCEGETSALVAGLAFNLLGRISNRELEVKVHPTNQSGASSNEISDIDVYETGSIVFIAEVKDKDFTNSDIEHSAKKAAANGVKELLFLVGPNSKTKIIQSPNSTWGDTLVKVTILDLFDFFASIYGLLENIDNTEFIKIINHLAIKAKMKDQTHDYFRECWSNF